jgi:molybdopterin-guanine dinucleotide biosynthesis protein A
MDLVVVILAGGSGRRIGGRKPDRMLGGVRLLDRAVAQARSWSEDVVIACGASPLEAIGLVQVVDQQGSGPVAGLLAGIRHARHAGASEVLAIPCDTPFLPENLAERLARGRPDNCAVAMARAGGRLHPSCGLWRTEVEPAISAYLAEERRSLIGLAERVGYAAVEWEEESAFLNINTPEDLARAAKMLNS